MALGSLSKILIMKHKTGHSGRRKMEVGG